MYGNKRFVRNLYVSSQCYGEPKIAVQLDLLKIKYIMFFIEPSEIIQAKVTTCLAHGSEDYSQVNYFSRELSLKLKCSHTLCSTFLPIKDRVFKSLFSLA